MIEGEVVIKKVRKTRSDKKHEIRPTINYKLYKAINRIGYITQTPMKNVAATMCEAGLNSKKVIEILSVKFRYDYKMANTIFFGDRSRPSNRTKKSEELVNKLPIKFDQNIDDDIKRLAYSLDVTPTTAVRILLEHVIKDVEIVNNYLNTYIEDSLEGSRLKHLKLVFEFISHNNPYEEDITLPMLLNHIFDEIKDNTRVFTKVVGEWLEKHKSKI